MKTYLLGYNLGKIQHYKHKMTELDFYRDDGGKFLAELGQDTNDSAVRALAIILREIQGYAPSDAYNIAYTSIVTENARWEAAARKPRKKIKRYGRRGTKYADETVPRKVYEKVFSKYGLEKMKRDFHSEWPTYSQAYQKYGDCIVTSKGFVSAIIGGKLHDRQDWRTYEAQLESDYYFEDPEIEIRERKAGSVWAAGTNVDPCPSHTAPWLAARDDAMSAAYQESRACSALLTRSQQNALLCLTGRKREVKEKELKEAYYAGEKYPYPLLWEPYNKRPADWESRIKT